MAEGLSKAGASAQASIADTFKEFLGNLALDNEETISLRYGEITCALNKQFRDTESKTANSLQVGSYGRWTAIKGISDLDMLYIMPAGFWSTYKGDGGQSRLLRAAAKAISDRYPNTTVKVDRLVVQVLYRNFQIEVQPVFELEDGSFAYPDTYNGGKWKVTKPREELAAMAETDATKNKNLRRLCRMARAWKNKHGVPMGGLLIDTLAHRFLTSTTEYDDKSYLYYDWLVRDFFGYLANLEEQTEYAALGSGQRVKVKKPFQAKAKKAYKLALAAIDADGEDYRNDRWRRVFGKPFPPRVEELRKAAFVAEGGFQARNTQEFIEDSFPVDIRFPIHIDCEVTQTGFRTLLLRRMLASALPLYTRKSLRFFVAAHSIPDSIKFDLYWKVLNRGPEALRRNQIRGEIIRDAGRLERTEHTLFRGDHIVECYAVANGVVIATDRIHVPIDPAEES